MLVLLKTRKLVFKFKIPTPGAESPSFLQQRERFLDNLRKSPTYSSMLAVECTAMVFNALQINSYVFSEEIGANACSVDERSTQWHLRTANSASITSHGHPVETSGCGHATFDFRRAPATAWTWWCILANKGFPNLAVVTIFSPLPEQND